jgi:hypothetical protein
VDYVNGADYGKAHGPKIVFPARFDKYLLLEAQPL